MPDEYIVVWNGTKDRQRTCFSLVPGMRRSSLAELNPPTQRDDRSHGAKGFLEQAKRDLAEQEHEA